MRITILALGSRGDVQPFVALALALQQRGHAVRIAAPQDYAFLVHAYGVPFHVLGGLIREQMDMARVAAMLDGAGNPLRYAVDMLPQVVPLVGRLVADAWQASHDADALVVSTLGAYPGLSVAEKRRAPIVVAHFHPLAQTSGAQHVNFPALPPRLPGRAQYNRLTHFLGAHGLWQLLRPALNRARRGSWACRRSRPQRLSAPCAAWTRSSTVTAATSPRFLPRRRGRSPSRASGFCRARRAGSRTLPCWSFWRTARRPSTSALAAISPAARLTP